MPIVTEVVNLKLWRERISKTQEEMADLIGVPRSTYIKWEKDVREAPAVARKLFELIQLVEWLAPNVYATLHTPREAVEESGFGSGSAES